jgi:predicted DCC family thiol-disulfide oxidoreductase YuxK
MDPTVFYDGSCALCHGLVRFLLARDRGAFRFAPLDGPTFRAHSPALRRWPDSMVLLTDNGQWLVRSEAVLWTLRRLGGVWRVPAAMAGLAPKPVRDALYDWVARHRRQWFGEVASCPAVPPEQRARFLP